MSRYAYSGATTGRFTKWYFAHYLEHSNPPSLEKILHWLRDEEDYAKPLDELENLCEGLLLDDKHDHIVRWITGRLISALRDERQLVDKAKSFFTAMVEKCGIDDTEVRLYDNQTGHRVGTLHDLQLRKEVQVAK